jgi:hypothetical protein
LRSPLAVSGVEVAGLVTLARIMRV